MDIIKFNDGTPDLQCKILLKAESVIIARDNTYYYMVNTLKVDKCDKSQEKLGSSVHQASE